MQQQVSRKRFTFRVVLGLTLAVLLIYGETLGAGFTFWDDDVYVTRNPLIQELSPGSVGRLFTQFSNCNYHPLTYFTWMAEYSLVGLSPWLYHLDNVLLHVGVGVLVFLLTRRLLEGAHGELAALLVAVLFLVHPLRVESVAWIAERKDVLCVLFYLASLLVYLKFIDEGPDKRSYGLSLALFLAALLSKAMAISLPAVQVLLLVLRRSASRKQLLLLAPFWVLSVVFAVLAYLAQAACGAVTPIHGDTFLAHLLTVVKALAFYAQKLVVPHPLSARYVVEPAAGLGEPQVIVGLILVALATWAAWRSFGRRRLLFFGLGFFAVTWAPVSGIVPTSTLVADRYMYLPALGLLWPLGAAAGAALRGAVESRRHATAWVGLTLLLGTALVWGVLARERVHAWTDGIVLWQDALKENPENPYAYSQLGIEYHVRGDHARAVSHSIDSIRRGLQEPKFLFNLCLGYRSLGQLDKEVQTARGILAGAPDFLPAWMVVLRHLREEGRLAECAEKTDELLGEFPGAPPLLTARGDLRAEKGELAQALEDYVAVIRQQPNDRDVTLSASLTLARLGDGERAVRLAGRALALSTSELLPWELEKLVRLQSFLRGRHPDGR